MIKIRSACGLLMLGLTASWTFGCASVPKRNPLPTDLVESATIPGIEGARIWGDEVPYYADEFFAMTREETKATFPAWFGKQQHYLAISGGGAGGAFGAGLLKGWTEAGDRPEFQLVTGISTGALTAPFAFLGSEYDHLLEEIYTRYSTEDLLRKRKPITAFTSDALYNTKKMAELIARYYDDEIIDALAAEARKGRALNIGTTNLDVERPVIWRITTIAASDHPDRGDLIRSIILASASIPAAFPPVAIEVEANGQKYDELHVDGGTSSQVFLYPAAIRWDRVLEKSESPAPPRVFVIRNSRIDPYAANVNRKLMPIAGRSIGALIRSQGVGDLYRIFSMAERDGLEFNLAYIPASFDEVPEEAFDVEWMRELFQLGYEMGKDGYSWMPAPPQYGDPEDD
jgi:predicted patatin/cPLA2 family phospholipase